jgi:hypothetical protein
MAHQLPPGFAVSPNLTQNTSRTKTGSKKVHDQAVGCMRLVSGSCRLEDLSLPDKTHHSASQQPGTEQHA